MMQAATIGELAKAIGIAPQVLEDTVREYNANVEKGVDPQYGRRTLVAAFGKPVKIDKAPFYAMVSTAYILGTYGGIRVNGKAEETARENTVRVPENQEAPPSMT